MNKLDRIINEVYSTQEQSKQQFKKSKQKKNILKIKYEDLLIRPLLNLKKINKFLGLKSNINFKKYKSKINLSKIPNKNSISKKLEFIKKNSSPQSYKKLIYLQSIYN